MPDPHKPKNPFLHTHDHDHDPHGHGHDHAHHHHDDETIDELDPAQQSLSDALRVSFNLLKVIMLVLVAFYCFTGVFIVDASEVAIRLRFGRIVGPQDDPIYRRGWHFGWPYPIERKIKIPLATQRTVPIEQAFWFEVKEADLGKPLDQLTATSSGLNPQRDGSLITGEANVIHAQFDVKYRIADAVAYVTHVGSLEQADTLVRAAAEEGIIASVAAADTDSVLKKARPIALQARAHAQQVLDKLHTGIELTGDPADPDSANGVIFRTPTMPLSVRPAYYEGNNAESERAQKIADARTARTGTLNAAAGPAHDELFKLIQNYEYHHAAADEDAARQAAELIDAAFDRLDVNGQPIGGDAAKIINEARTYRTAVVEQIKGEANTFSVYLEARRDNPDLLRTQLWQQAREAIFAGDTETFHVAAKPYLVINRDPEVRRRREQDRLQQAKEAGTTPPR